MKKQMKSVIPEKETGATQPEEIVDISIDITDFILDQKKSQEQAPSAESDLASKSLRDKLEYFKGKARDGHGTQINLKSKQGNRSVWMNPFNLLKDDNPMNSEEMEKAMASLGINSENKLKVGQIECKSLGFMQSFHPAKKLDATTIENIAILSGALVELDENGHTELFKELVAEQRINEISELLCFYEKFETSHVYDLKDADNQIKKIGYTVFQNQYPETEYTKEELSNLKETYDFLQAGKEQLLNNGYREVAGHLIKEQGQEPELVEEQEFYQAEEELNEELTVEMTMEMG